MPVLESRLDPRDAAHVQNHADMLGLIEVMDGLLAQAARGGIDGLDVCVEDILRQHCHHGEIPPG